MPRLQQEELWTQDNFPSPAQRSVRLNEISFVDFLSDADEQLIESVRLLGVLQPVILQEQADGRYFPVAGRRRINAARQAGLEFVPALIYPSTMQLPLRSAMTLAENMVRGDNVVHEARTVRSLAVLRGLSATEIAERLRLPVSAVEHRLAVGSLPEAILHAAENMRISRTGLQQVLRMTMAQRDRVSDWLVSNHEPIPYRVLREIRRSDEEEEEPPTLELQEPPIDLTNVNTGDLVAELTRRGYSVTFPDSAIQQRWATEREPVDPTPVLRTVPAGVPVEEARRAQRVAARGGAMTAAELDAAVAAVSPSFRSAYSLLRGAIQAVPSSHLYAMPARRNIEHVAQDMNAMLDTLQPYAEAES
jgi:ParB/RepB/Spo0J family partition protein